MTVPTGSDFKALVCLFLYGGNDANNLIVPHDVSGYADYADTRGILAIPQESLLPITLQNGDGRDFGFHPSIPELQALFNQGRLGIVANVGTLVAPITRAQYLAGGAAVPLSSSRTPINPCNGRHLFLTNRREPVGAGEWPMRSVLSTGIPKSRSRFRSQGRTRSKSVTLSFHTIFLPVEALV